MLQSSQKYARAYPPSCPGYAARTVTVPAWQLSIPDGARVTDLLTGSVHEVEFDAHYGAILVQ